MLKLLQNSRSGSGQSLYRPAQKRKFSSTASGQLNRTQTSWFGAKTIVSVLVALFMSIASYATHYKGGQITYENLGGGTYKVTVKSYWRSALPGSVAPSYSGSPTLNTPLTAVSLTPLPDGVTVEKVEQQVVTWNQPGLYTISWTSCCRVNAGANFGQSDMGLFAAVNYNPAQPSSSPQFYDLPVFNYAANIPMSFSFNNTDPEGHVQEYSLNTPYGILGNPYSAMTASGFAVANNGTVSWTNPQQGLWLVNVKLAEKINGVLTGAYVYRDFMLNIVPTTNHAPVLTAINPLTVVEGQSLQFSVNASDSDGNNVTLRASGLPLTMGATFAQNVTGSNPSGTFTWTPALGTAGSYSLQFVATDNATSPLSSQITVPVTVTSAAPACNVTSTAQVTSVPCANQGNDGSIVITAAGGNSYQYSIDGGLTFQTSNTFTGLAPGTYEAMAKDGACASAAQQVVIIANPLPVVTFDNLGKVCVNNGLVTLSGGQPLGGAYSGSGVNNGLFDPAAAGVGTHTIYYTYTNSNGCSNTTSSQITVNPLPSVTLQNFGTVCVNTPAFSLNQGTPPGGTYSGAGVSNNIFNPAVAGAGIHTLTYTLTDTAGCSISASLDIVVEALPVVTFGTMNNVCANAPAFTLTQGAPAGGIYSGPGVSNGKFSAVAAGSGMHTLTYTYATANGCSASATQTITVNSLLAVNAGPDKTVVPAYAANKCATLSAAATGGNGGFTYRWNTGATTAAISVCPTVATTYTVTVTDAAGCSATDQVNVGVVDAVCGKRNEKVIVCHGGNELCIAPSAVPAHLAHGDQLGSCNSNAGTHNKAADLVLTTVPNPFTQNTTINFTMPQTGTFVLEVYDLKGMLVKKVAEGSALGNEMRSIEVNGSEWPQGIYFARLITGSTVSTTKLLLVK